MRLQNVRNFIFRVYLGSSRFRSFEIKKKISKYRTRVWKKYDIRYFEIFELGENFEKKFEIFLQILFRNFEISKYRYRNIFF